MKHFLSSKVLFPLFVCLAGFQFTVRANQVVYDDALENGWQNWSWATVNFSSASPNPVHSGNYAISVNCTNYQALYLHNTPFSSSLYTNLTFWINGGSGGQPLKVQATTNTVALNTSYTFTPAAGVWQQIIIPLSALGITNQPNMDGFFIQGNSSVQLATFYVDDISLVTNVITPGTNAPVSITVNAQENRNAISPLIYGTAFATSNQLSDLNFTMNRSGGDNETRYNWQLNAHNIDADWYFESVSDGAATPGAAADDFVANSKNGGAQAMLSIPMIGWTTKLGPGRASLASYSTNKYGAQTGSDPYWPAAGNGISQATGLYITNDPTDANMTADTNFQAGWVQHLTNQWGTATNGGLLYYIMDNEWSLWDSTHRDVHPVGATMDEVFTDFCNYATMVKGIDPNALVAGPEEWGWPGYLYSGYDQQWSGAHNDNNPADYPDRTAHGGQDFGPWFLSQVQQHGQTAGQRLLDIFTLHCYPQEGNVSGNAVDSATELLRNQSTRQFWDTNYVDPSWINSVIMLIPRMKIWVATNYPGTKIGITEYNWGAEPSINGATAQADILGIFGREGLDLATRWTTPAANTPTYLAMKLYRNYDGDKSTFGDTNILTTVPNPDDLSAFGAVRTGDGAMTLMVINKDLYNATPITANITNFNAAGTAQRWQLTSTNTINHLADITLTNRVLSDMLPAQSITLFVLPVMSTFSLQIATNNSPGQLGIWLYGQGEQSYALQSSPDLFHWSAISTNTLSSNSFEFFAPTTNSAQMFYRAMLNGP